MHYRHRVRGTVEAACGHLHRRPVWKIDPLRAPAAVEDTVIERRHATAAPAPLLRGARPACPISHVCGICSTSIQISNNSFTTTTVSTFTPAADFSISFYCGFRISSLRIVSVLLFTTDSSICFSIRSTYQLLPGKLTSFLPSFD